MNKYFIHIFCFILLICYVSFMHINNGSSWNCLASSNVSGAEYNNQDHSEYKSINDIEILELMINHRLSEIIHYYERITNLTKKIEKRIPKLTPNATNLNIKNTIGYGAEWNGGLIYNNQQWNIFINTLKLEHNITAIQQEMTTNLSVNDYKNSDKNSIQYDINTHGEAEKLICDLLNMKKKVHQVSNIITKSRSFFVQEKMLFDNMRQIIIILDTHISWLKQAESTAYNTLFSGY